MSRRRRGSGDAPRRARELGTGRVRRRRGSLDRRVPTVGDNVKVVISFEAAVLRKPKPRKEIIPVGLTGKIVLVSKNNCLKVEFAGMDAVIIPNKNLTNIEVAIRTTEVEVAVRRHRARQAIHILCILDIKYLPCCMFTTQSTPIEQPLANEYSTQGYCVQQTIP